MSFDRSQACKVRRLSIVRILLGVGAVSGVCLGILSGRTPVLEAALPEFASAARDDSFLPDALQLRLTAQGMEFLSSNIESLVLANGLDLRRQSRPRLEIAVAKPIRLEQIPAGMAGERSTLADLATTVREWLRGRIQLQPPKPKFTLENASYALSDSADGTRRVRFSLRPNLEATRQWRGSDPDLSGAVFDLEARIPELRLSAESLRISDPMNSYLGEWTFSRPEIRVASTPEASLYVRLRVLVTGTSAGIAHVELLSSSSNLASLPVSASFAWLKIPTITVKVNGASYPMDSRPLVDALKEQLPGMARLARNSAAEGLAGGFLPLLESSINTWLASRSIGTADLEVPTPCGLAGCGKQSLNLHLGFARSVLGIDHDPASGGTDLRLRLFADWNGDAGTIAASMRGFPAALAPEEDGLFEVDMTPADSSVDVVAALDARIYNKVLRDAWNSGWRPELPEYRILDAPQVKIFEGRGGRKALLSVPLQLEPTNFTEAQLFGSCMSGEAAYDPYRVEAAAQLQAAPAGNGGNGIDLIRTGLDVGETWVDPSQFSSCALATVFVTPSLEQRRAILSSLVGQRLETISQELAADPQALAEALSLPESLLGVKLQLRDAELREGRILLHLRFEGVAR